ncbi:hypothetical protein OCA96_18130 [Bacillus cereus]|nr:hypothetical protein [Bacillus cereus]
MKLAEMGRENKKKEQLEEQRIIAVFTTAIELLKDDNTKQWIEYVAYENGLLSTGCFRKPIKKNIIVYVAMLYSHIIISRDKFGLNVIPHLKCTKKEFADVILNTASGIIEEMEPLQDIHVNFNDFIEQD